MVQTSDRSSARLLIRLLVFELAALVAFALFASVGMSADKSSVPRKQTKAQKKKKAKKRARPNIVLIQADDAIRSDIQYLPNVRRHLSRGGTRFTNMVVPYPLCGPARAALLTGQLSHNNRIVSNFRSNDGGHLTFKDLPGRLNHRNSLAPWLKKAGYRTGMVGKYLNEYGVFDRKEVPPGWDYWAALIDNSTYDYFNFGMNVNRKVRIYGDQKYAESQMQLGTDTATKPPTNFAEMIAAFRKAFDPWDYFGTQVDSDYTMDVNGAFAAKFVRKAAPKKKPFFLYYAPPGPHAEDTNHIQGLREGAPGPDPRPPSRYAHAFDHLELPRPASFNEADVSDKAQNIRGLAPLTDTQIEQMTASYRGRLGALRAVDDQVGKIIKELKRAGEFKNTYIVFTSDNGYIQGAHRLRSSKFLPFEDSIRVPTFVRGPGIKAGKARSGAAMDVDLTRTILQMAKAKPGRTMDGISLLPAARGKKKLPRRDIPLEAMRPLFLFFTPVTAFDLPYYGVRTNRYKYLNWSFGEQELYDLKKDPDEMENLAKDPSQAARLQALETEAKRLQTCKGKACG